MCGLKPYTRWDHRWGYESHPSWVCGLKLNEVVKVEHCELCHTLRGCVDWNINYNCFFCHNSCHTLRGCVDWNHPILNQLANLDSHTLRGCVDWNIFIRRYKSNFYFVTPFVGVWIETPLPVRQLADWNVTPFVGVWIETTSLRLSSVWILVTPFVGVWIETDGTTETEKARGRHTLRGCVDWNFREPLHVLGCCVTPFVGVWIETCFCPLLPCRRYVTPFVGVWIETEGGEHKGSVQWVTPFVGGWIETTEVPCLLRDSACHTLRGCVDWNNFKDVPSEVYAKSHPSWVCGLKLPVYPVIDLKAGVTPFEGVGIETSLQGSAGLPTGSHPSWVCGLKLWGSRNIRYAL